MGYEAEGVYVGCGNVVFVALAKLCTYTSLRSAVMVLETGKRASFD